MRNRFIFLLLLVVQLTSCEWNGNFEKADDDSFICREKVNDSISISMFGTVEDVGFTDMIFHRTIHLIKGQDSLFIPIKDSEFRCLKCATVQLTDSTKRIVLYNRENPDFVVIDPIHFTLDEAPSVIEQIKGDNIYHLEDQSIFLCPIPGTIVQ